MAEDHPPRGVDACIEALEKRRAWVVRRSGGGYDVREGIALGYAIGMLKAAKRKRLIQKLETDGVTHGDIYHEWVEQPKGEQ